MAASEVNQFLDRPYHKLHPLLASGSMQLQEGITGQEVSYASCVRHGCAVGCVWGTRPELLEHQIWETGRDVMVCEAAANTQTPSSAVPALRHAVA